MLTRASLVAMAGAGVLAAGVVVVASAIGPGAAPSQEPRVSTPSTSRVSVPEGVSTPRIPGVKPAIQRVLETGRMAETRTADELPQLAPAIARVLVEYGATLTVPVAPATEPGQ